ncbi:MAG: N-acetylmuramoyl-L-alanine amidase [Desulfosudaceae bacterium]
MKQSYRTGQVFRSGLSLVLLLLIFSGNGVAGLATAGIVAIDPGHGGYDTGAGNHDLVEKDINLALSRELAARLRPLHRIVFTRTGDYSLKNIERVAKANQAGADVYVSIHAVPGKSGPPFRLTVSYLEKSGASQQFPAEESLVSAGSHEAAAGPGRKFLRWETLHNDHQAFSKRAARLTGTFLDEIPEVSCRVTEARLAVLEGADMPAMMIEISLPPAWSPGTEEFKSVFLTKLADAIARVVDQLDSSGRLEDLIPEKSDP